MEKKKKTHRAENIVRKGEIACYKQFLLYLQFFLQPYIFSVSKCSILFMFLRKKAFENIVGKGENAGNRHFLLFSQCFLLIP